VATQRIVARIRLQMRGLVPIQEGTDIAMGKIPWCKCPMFEICTPRVWSHC